MSRWLGALVVLVTALVTSPASAGDRAYYIVFATIGADTEIERGNANAFLTQLLACGQEALPACRAARRPGGDQDMNGNVVLVDLAPAMTREAFAAAARGNATARRTLVASVNATQSGVDGIVVFEWTARGADIRVLDRRGRSIGRARLPTRNWATPGNAPDWAPIVRRVIAPIARRFSP